MLEGEETNAFLKRLQNFKAYLKRPETSHQSVYVTSQRF